MGGSTPSSAGTGTPESARAAPGGTTPPRRPSPVREHVELGSTVDRGDARLFDMHIESCGESSACTPHASIRIVASDCASISVFGRLVDSIDASAQFSACGATILSRDCIERSNRLCTSSSPSSSFRASSSAERTRSSPRKTRRADRATGAKAVGHGRQAARFCPGRKRCYGPSFLGHHLHRGLQYLQPELRVVAAPGEASLRPA